MSCAPSRDSTRSSPRSTTVNSSNSGTWPGSLHPGGLDILAILNAAVAEFTRPTNSRIVLGGVPTASTLVDLAMICSIEFFSLVCAERRKDTVFVQHVHIDESDLLNRASWNLSGSGVF